jgi:hypothetical protein
VCGSRNKMERGKKEEGKKRREGKKKMVRLYKL